MNPSTLRQFIRTVISRELNLPRDVITDQAILRELPGVESVKFLRIIVAVEREYSIELDDDVVFHIETIDELSKAVFERAAFGKSNERT